MKEYKRKDQHIPRELRRNQTHEEKVLWNCLRNKKLRHRFRRQHPTGPYIADFCCLEKRLIVELDGYHHGLPEIQEYDKTRTLFLESQGFKVVRFWNTEVTSNLKRVLQTIREALHIPLSL